VVGSVGVEIVGELLPPLLESVPAAAIPAKTRIALMMMAAFVMSSLLPSASSLSDPSVPDDAPRPGYAKAKPR
jgi:hypothetical protein